MLKQLKPKELRATRCFTAALGMVALLSHASFADTVYRCGESYSTSSQCTHATATEVKPSTVLHTTGPDPTNAFTRDLRDAQALEKQRLQAEQQAVQTASVRLNTASTPSAKPSPDSVSQPESIARKRKGKHAKKANNPYFTAVDPTATPKKKSTAKAVPATSTP